MRGSRKDEGMNRSTIRAFDRQTHLRISGHGEQAAWPYLGGVTRITHIVDHLCHSDPGVRATPVSVATIDGE